MSVNTKTATRSETSNSQSCNLQIEKKLENMIKKGGNFIEETELIFNEDRQKVIFSYLFHNTKQLINNFFYSLILQK